MRTAFGADGGRAVSGYELPRSPDVCEFEHELEKLLRRQPKKEGVMNQGMDVRTMVVWIVALVLVAAVVCSPVACTMRRHQIIADAIASGTDPIEAKCAIESSDDLGRANTLCLAKALGK
jgi:hypothetical protein